MLLKVFRHNKARLGAALAAIQKSNISFKSHDFIIGSNGINKTEISNNTAEFNGSIYLSNNSTLLFGEETDINHNKAALFGGGVYTTNSLITISSSVVNFNSNRAKFGGGLGLASSKINNVIDEYSTNVGSVINFMLNQADKYGGALYVDDDWESDDICLSDLFLKMYPDTSGCFFQNVISGLMINFSHNSANASGHDLFGGLLDRCTVVVSTNFSEIEASGTARFLNISNIENFNHTVSSKAVRVCPCNGIQPNCSQEAYQIEMKRGKVNVFSILLAAVDQVHQPVGAMISSEFEDDTVSVSQTVQSKSTDCSNVEFQASFPEVSKEYKLSVFADGPCNNKSISSFVININVTDCFCPPGFMPQDDSTDCSCICDHKLTEQIENLECNMTDESIIREGEYWVTFLNDTACDNTSSPYCYFVYSHCPLDYCKSPSEQTPIKLSELNGSDAQCVNNRGGLLCGSCLSSYSLSLGSSKCVTCPESDTWISYGLPIGIILAAFFIGISLVILLLVLNLTVTVGTLNSIIFYANIIDVNRSIYFGQSHNLTFIPFFISWLNLDIGFDTCFIEGMDLYYKTWLQLALPAYLILMVIVIILISSCSSKFANLIGKKNLVATLAILILLSYTRLLETVITSFSFVHLQFPNGTNTSRWLPDASIEFATGKHITLICVAIPILMLGLIYTFLIFSWQWLLNTKSCKWTKNQKLHSFIDTYHVPHTMKHRYWTGLLLLVRIIVYIISAFSLSTDPRIKLLSVVTIMCCLFLYKTIFIIRVYKNWSLNAMDSFVYFNIATFTIFTWFTYDDLLSKQKAIFQTFVAYISVGTTAILTFLVIIFHIIYRYGNANFYSKGQKTKLAKKISSQISDYDYEDKQRDVWSRSRGTYKLLNSLDRPRESRGYVPPPPKLTSSLVSLEDCDKALTSDSQSTPGKSNKKKPRAKSHIPKGTFDKISECARLRKTEPKLAPLNEITTSLLLEEEEL